MYRDRFGLRCKPFGNTPDPTFFYFSADHRLALVQLSRGIEDRCGLMLLLGEVGTGKSTVCCHIHNHDGYLSGYLNYPFLTEVEFLETVNRELRIPVGDGSRKSITDELRGYLLKQHRRGKPVVLIVDEAHRLGLPILDEILLLSNMQVPDAQLLQIILAGQPALLNTLQHPRLGSLNQRITVRYQLPRMDRANTIHYVCHRLEKAGCKTTPLFTSRALETVWKRSRGTPRLINQLSDRALSEAYQKGKTRVSSREVKQVANDPLYKPLFAGQARGWSMRTAFAGSILALLVGLSLGLWYFGLGGKFISETAREVRHAQVERSTVIKKPIIIPSLAEKSGNEPASPELMVDGGPVPAVALGEGAPGRPEWQQPQATHPVSISESLEERMAGGEQLSTIADLPDLKLSAIAWDEDSARSMAVLNDKILHEGDFLGDVRVLRIKPNHIVLIYGDEHIIKRIHKQEQDQTPEAIAMPFDGDKQAGVSKPNDEKDAEEAFPFSNFRPIISFDYKTSKLAPEAYEELDRLATIAKLSPSYEIVIRGYADNVGSYKYNKRLSRSRAKIVQSYLVGKGVNPGRIKTLGMGETNPLMPNITPAGRAANRRVEIELVPVGDY